MIKKTTIRLNEAQFENLLTRITKASVKRIMNEEYHPFRPFPQEEPEPFKRVVITDKNGRHEGHLSTPIVWDGENFRTDLAHNIHVDVDNIVGWKYLNEI